MAIRERRGPLAPADRWWINVIAIASLVALGIVAASNVAGHKAVGIVLTATATSGLTVWLMTTLALRPSLPQPMLNPAIRYVGKISYGIYLYHMVIGAYLLNAGLRAWSLWAFVTLATAITIAVAALSWHLIERPLLALKPYPPR